MSLNSGLTRDKHGTLLKDGKPYVVGLATGDDTPVKVDERFDVDLNRLVSNEMARQDLIRIATEKDYADLTDYPASRGEAEQRLRDVTVRLRPLVRDGESPLEALKRGEARGREIIAQAKPVKRDSNATDGKPVATDAPPAPIADGMPPPGSEPPKPK